MRGHVSNSLAAVALGALLLSSTAWPCGDEVISPEQLTCDGLAPPPRAHVPVRKPGEFPELQMQADQAIGAMTVGKAKVTAAGLTLEVSASIIAAPSGKYGVVVRSTVSSKYGVPLTVNCNPLELTGERGHIKDGVAVWDGDTFSNRASVPAVAKLNAQPAKGEGPLLPNKAMVFEKLFPARWGGQPIQRGDAIQLRLGANLFCFSVGADPSDPTAHTRPLPAVASSIDIATLTVMYPADAQEPSLKIGAPTKTERKEAAL